MSFSNFKFTTFKEKALNILSIITILCCGCVLLSLFASLHWILDLFRHFTVKYFFILTSLSLIFLIERKWVYGFTAALFSLICFYPIAPYYTSKKLTQPDESNPITIASWNVLSSNSNHTKALNALKQLDTDFIFLMEVNKEWRDQLSPLEVLYPYHITIPREDNFGVAFYSKLPFIHSEVIYFDQIPSIHIQVQQDGNLLNLYGIHPIPPISKSASAFRNDQLKSAGKFIKNLEGEVILAGDFNATPFSDVFSHLLSETSLRDSSLGFGLKSTWKRNLPLFSLPIDHILISKQLGVTEHKILGNYGSDHNLIWAKINFL